MEAEEIARRVLSAFFGAPPGSFKDMSQGRRRAAVKAVEKTRPVFAGDVRPEEVLEEVLDD